MEDDESFTVEGLKKDIRIIDEISLSWRKKMEFLPADQQFAMFRRAVSHLEKGISLADKIVARFMGGDADENPEE